MADLSPEEGRQALEGVLSLAEGMQPVNHLHPHTIQWIYSKVPPKGERGCATSASDWVTNHLASMGHWEALEEHLNHLYYRAKNAERAA